MEDFSYSKPIQHSDVVYIVMGGATVSRSRSASKLDVRGCSIGRIPEEVAENLNLETLLLTENEITEIPSFVSKLINLKELYAACNYLTTLPPAIKYLTHLTALNLYNNRISALPQELAFCTALKLLVLSRNRLTSFPEIGALTLLENLEIAENRLTSLPLSFLSLKSLTFLNLQGNKLKTLPSDLGQLQSLLKLNLKGNRLSSLPSSISQLTNLLFLNLRENLLEKLPTEIDGLVSLVDLDITQNDIVNLPWKLGWMKSLKNLRSAFNPIEEPPKEIMSQSLESIMAYLRQHETTERKKSLIQKLQNVRETLSKKTKKETKSSEKEEKDISRSPSPSSSPTEVTTVSWKKRTPSNLPALNLVYNENEENKPRKSPTIGRRDKGKTFNGKDVLKTQPPRLKAKTLGSKSEEIPPLSSNQVSKEKFIPRDEKRNSFKSFNEIIEQDSVLELFERPVGRERARSYTHPPPFIRGLKPNTIQNHLLQSYRMPGFKPLEEIKYPSWWNKDIHLLCLPPCTCSTYSSEEANIPSVCVNCGHEAASHSPVSSNSVSNKNEKEEIKKEDDSFNLHFMPWLIDAEEIQFTETLGTGQTAKVYKGVYRGQEVALKVFKRSPLGKDWENFKKELNILSSVRSPNLNYFFGAVLRPKICVVMEYCPLGTLLNVMQNPEIPFTWERAIDFCLGVTQGVLCLHSWKPQIVHRDLKSVNLLITSNYVVKIGDFGLSRFLTQKNISSLGKMRGTYAYCAPEIYFGSNFTVKSDIYSLSIVFWEIFNRLLRNKYELPYQDHPELQIEFKVIVSVAQNGVRPTMPPNIPPIVEDLLKSCWGEEPEKRPSCEMILEKIESIEKEFHKNTKRWNALLHRNKS